MTHYDPTEIEGTDLDDRDVRALTEYLTVLPEAPGLYEVVSQSGESYTVDAFEAEVGRDEFLANDEVAVGLGVDLRLTAGAPHHGLWQSRSYDGRILANAYKGGELAR